MPLNMVLTRPGGGRYLGRVGDDHGVFGCPRAPKVPPCASKLRSARVMAQPAATPATEAAKAAPAPVTARSKRVQARSVQAFSQFVRSQDHFSNHTTSQIDVLKQDLKAVDQLQARLLKKITELKLAALPTTFSASPPPPSEAEPIGFPVTYAVIHNVSKFLGGEGDRVLPTRVCKAWLRCRGQPRPMRRVTRIGVHAHLGALRSDLRVDAIEFTYCDDTTKTWGKPYALDRPECSDRFQSFVLEDDELVAIETYTWRSTGYSFDALLSCGLGTLLNVAFVTRRGRRFDALSSLKQAQLQEALVSCRRKGRVPTPEEIRGLEDSMKSLETTIRNRHAKLIHRSDSDGGAIAYLSVECHSSFVPRGLKGIVSVGDANFTPRIQHTDIKGKHSFDVELC